MSNIITFYDIPSTIPGNAWSPNTYKTRYSLNFKGLPYKTVWVEYPDIEALSKELGVSPTEKRSDGSPLYTLPAIYDPLTRTALADSALIAAYLDETYPNTPRLYPPGTHALQLAAIDAHWETLSALWQFTAPATHRILNPKSKEYFRKAREASLGGKLEDVVPRGERCEEEWAKVREGFSVVDGWLQKGGGPYFIGNTNCFADFVVGSFILWLKKAWGEDSPEWKDIKTWNEGRWVKFLKGIEKYEKIS